MKRTLACLSLVACTGVPLLRHRVGGGDDPASGASGNGGQIAMAIPRLDLVVVFMSGNDGIFATWGHFVEDWGPQYIIPAATAPAL